MPRTTIAQSCTLYSRLPIAHNVIVLPQIATTVGIAKDSINVLMEGTPAGIHIKDIHESLMKVGMRFLTSFIFQRSIYVFSFLWKIEGVEDVVDIHVWSLTIGQVALSVHLNTNSGNQHLVLKEAQKVGEHIVSKFLYSI